MCEALSGELSCPCDRSCFLISQSCTTCKRIVFERSGGGGEGVKEGEGGGRRRHTGVTKVVPFC